MIVFPAGKYWIGDPCFLFSDKDFKKWQDLLYSVDFFDSISYGESPDHKIKICASKPVYGNGIYMGSNGKRYDVDSGLLGIVSQESVDYLTHNQGDFDCISTAGTFVEFPESFVVEVKNGVFHFGEISINTFMYY